MLFDKDPVGAHLNATNLFVPVKDKHTTEEDYVQVNAKGMRLLLRRARPANHASLKGHPTCAFAYLLNPPHKRHLSAALDWHLWNCSLLRDVLRVAASKAPEVPCDLGTEVQISSTSSCKSAETEGPSSLRP